MIFSLMGLPTAAAWWVGQHGPWQDVGPGLDPPSAPDWLPEQVPASLSLSFPSEV